MGLRSDAEKASPKAKANDEADLIWDVSLCFLAGHSFTIFPNHEYFILEQTVQGVFKATSTHMLFRGLLSAFLACSLLNDSSLLLLSIASS